MEDTKEKSRIWIRNTVYRSVDPVPYPYQNVTDPEHCLKLILSARKKNGVIDGGGWGLMGGWR
jgi:hypothetical protein